MSTITTINASDQITNSRSVINTNFANLNTDKIETSVIDTDTSLAANSDSKIPSQKAVKTYIDTSGGANASESARGIVEEATDAEVSAGTATGGTGAKLFITPAKLATRFSTIFGGTGADGALSITSGTTTIDLGSAATVIKNYTSISITGTGVLAFSNPATNGTLIVLKSQGAVTITSSATPDVDLRSLGGAGGTGGGTNTNGNAGSSGVSSMVINVPNGTGGNTAGTAGVGGPIWGGFGGTLKINGKLIPFGCGAGGGGGSGGFNGGNDAQGGGGGASLVASGSSASNPASNTSNGTGGDGGRGGGALYVECGGALNVTGVLNASGATGSNGASGAGGGGGGGGGGTIVILYTSLTANSGTYTVTGGSGGTGSGTSSDGGAGGAGSSLVAKNTEFV